MPIFNYFNRFNKKKLNIILPIFIVGIIYKNIDNQKKFNNFIHNNLELNTKKLNDEFDKINKFSIIDKLLNINYLNNLLIIKSLQTLSENFKKVNKQNQQNQEKLQNLTEKNQNLTEENQKLTENFETKNQQNQKKLQNLTKENEELTKKFETTNQQNQEKLQNLNQEDQKLTENFETTNQQNQEKLQNLNQENQKLTEENEELKNIKNTFNKHNYFIVKNKSKFINLFLNFFKNKREDNNFNNVLNNLKLLSLNDSNFKNNIFVYRNFYSTIFFNNAKISEEDIIIFNNNLFNSIDKNNSNQIIKDIINKYKLTDYYKAMIEYCNLQNDFKEFYQN